MHVGVYNGGGEIEFDDSLELWSATDDKLYVDELYRQINLDENKINIVLGVSTSTKIKDWPVEYFIKVCGILHNKYEANFILLGAGKKDLEYGRKFQEKVPWAYNVIGKTTLRQTTEIMKRSQVYFGCDTGPLHIAAACGLAGVAIYRDAKDTLLHPRMDEWFAPWKSAIKIIQPEHNLPGCEYGCNKEEHCIKQIKPEMVLQELEPILENLQH